MPMKIFARMMIAMTLSIVCPMALSAPMPAGHVPSPILKDLDQDLFSYAGETPDQIRGLLKRNEDYIAFNKGGFEMLVWRGKVNTFDHGTTIETDDGFIFKGDKLVGVSKISIPSGFPTGLSGGIIDAVTKKHGERKSIDGSGDPGQVEGYWDLKDQDIVVWHTREHHLLKGVKSELDKIGSWY